MSNYLGFDIGGTNIKYGVLNEQGKILKFSKFETVDDKEEIYKQFKKVLDENAELNIQGVAVSVPGFVDSVGYLRTAGAIFSLYRTNLKDELEKELGVKVLVENDANCATLAENWIGIGKLNKNFILLTVGTGIGGGVVINNSLVRGKNFRCGEFGYMAIDPVIKGDTKSASLSKVAAMPSLYNYYFVQTTKRLEDGKRIFQLYQAGDKSAKFAVRRFVHELGIAVFNLMMCFDPEKIILGGAVSENQLFIDLVRTEVKELLEGHSELEDDTPVQIDAAKFLNQSGVIGAVSLFINK